MMLPNGLIVEDYTPPQLPPGLVVEDQAVLDPTTMQPMPMGETSPKSPIDYLGEFGGEIGGGVAGEALGMGLLAGAGMTNPLTMLPAAGVLAGMGGYLGGNLAREAMGTNTPEQEPTLAGLAASGGAGAVMNLIPGAMQARAAKKVAERGFMMPTLTETYQASKALGAPVGATDTAAGSFGVGKLFKSKAAEEVNTAVNELVGNLAGGKLGLPDRAARNELWGQYGSELIEKSGGAEVQHGVSPQFKEAVAYFLKNPNEIPPSLKDKWAKWLPRVREQFYWPGAAEGSKVYKAGLKNTQAQMIVEEIPRPDGNVTVMVRKGAGRPKSAGSFAPSVDAQTKLKFAAKELGEVPSGAFEPVGTGRVSFEDLRDIYVNTREGVALGDFKDMSQQAQKALAAVKDGAEESLTNVNQAVSDAIMNQHKPLANMGQAERQIQGAVSSAMDKIKGPNGEVVTVFNPRKFSETVKKLEGIWEPRTTGTSLLTPEQRTTLKQWVKTLETTAGDLDYARKMYAKGGPISVWDAAKESGGAMLGGAAAQGLSQYVPLPGAGVVMVAPGFDALLALAMTNPKTRFATKAGMKVATAVPGKAIRYGLPANVGDMFGNKEKK